MIETKDPLGSKTYWKETIGAVALCLVAHLGPKFFPEWLPMVSSLLAIALGGAGMQIRNHTDTPITGSAKDPNKPGATLRSSWLVMIAALIVVFFVSGCTNANQRVTSYGGLKLASMVYDLSISEYERCNASAISLIALADQINEEIECHEAHLARKALTDRAEPFLQGSVIAAINAPDGPLDTNLQKARSILLPMQALLLSPDLNPNQRKAMRFMGAGQ